MQRPCPDELVDIEAEHQRLAQAYTEVGAVTYGPHHPGRGLDVLPWPTDGYYDLVFADGDKVEYGAYLEARLLRSGERGRTMA